MMQEKDVKLSRQDADGFVHGCFDTTRTFNGESNDAPRLSVCRRPPRN